MQYSERFFEDRDLYNVFVRDHQIAEVDYVKQHEQEMAAYRGVPRFKTLLYGEEIVCIFGCPYGGYGTYVPTLVPGKNIKRHLRKVIRFIYKYFITEVPSDVRRLEAVVDVADEKAVRFAKYFGFDIIGIRHQACVNGNDQVIVERLCSKMKKEALDL